MTTTTVHISIPPDHSPPDRPIILLENNLPHFTLPTLIPTFHRSGGYDDRHQMLRCRMSLPVIRPFEQGFRRLSEVGDGGGGCGEECTEERGRVGCLPRSSEGSGLAYEHRIKRSRKPNEPDSIQLSKERKDPRRSRKLCTAWPVQTTPHPSFLSSPRTFPSFWAVPGEESPGSEIWIRGGVWSSTSWEGVGGSE